MVITYKKEKREESKIEKEDDFENQKNKDKNDINLENNAEFENGNSQANNETI